MVSLTDILYAGSGGDDIRDLWDSTEAVCKTWSRSAGGCGVDNGAGRAAIARPGRHRRPSRCHGAAGARPLANPIGRLRHSGSEEKQPKAQSQKWGDE